MRFLNFFSIFVAKYMDMSEQEIEQQNTVTDDNRMILRTENLVKKYGKRTVVSHVSFDVKQGEIVGLLGPNGAGKTTLMRVIVGIAKHYQGEVLLNGDGSEVYRKANIAMTDNLKGLSDSTKVGEVEEFYQKLFVDFDSSKFEQLRSFMKLNNDMKLGQLSRGMREKLEIALTLSREAKLYLLDEPFSGIDPMARKRIINSILLWKSPDSTIVISDHFVNEITTILDEVVIVKDKKIASHLSADDIRAKGHSIEEYYESLYADEGAE